MINFVTNLPPTLRSGGFSAMNVVAFEAISGAWETAYVGPVDPPVERLGSGLSKLLRLAGAQGRFSFFSGSRLWRIAGEVASRRRPEAELDFFHGFTPWILTKPPAPYACWSDCTFRDYLSIYHDRHRFDSADVARIEQAEAAWLKQARRVLFTSRWAADRAIAEYGLDPALVVDVGIFGEADRPSKDVFSGGKAFAFISTHFEAKGGPMVLAAFRALRATHPDATLTVVGARPARAADLPGVSFTGYLRKEVPDEARQLSMILAGARAVVHPTHSDIAPLLLVEAAYFGCPAIASRRFAIPELVQHGRTGHLIDDPDDVASITSAMRAMLESDDYPKMRREALRKAHAVHTKEAFRQRMVAAVGAALAETALSPS